VPVAGLHGVPPLANTSAGQAAEEPVHVSATSHAPAEARQPNPAWRMVSEGQTGETPSHTSATSQSPAAVRHVESSGRTTSGGHCGDNPVQVSATSQELGSAVRQAVVAGW
jgi:hypothetical protein